MDRLGAVDLLIIVALRLTVALELGAVGAGCDRWTVGLVPATVSLLFDVDLTMVADEFLGGA